MAQCDVFFNLSAETRDYAPYVLDLQSELLDGLPTRIIVPLVPASRFGALLGALHPRFEIDGKTFVLAMHLMGSTHKSLLGALKLSLASHRYTIIRALDVIVTGV